MLKAYCLYAQASLFSAFRGPYGMPETEIELVMCNIEFMS